MNRDLAQCNAMDKLTSNAFALELERLKRQNAAMREALEDSHTLLRDIEIPERHAARAGAQISDNNDALAFDAGSDLLTREQVKPLVEALCLAYQEVNLIHARCGVPWWDTGKSDVTQDHFTHVVETARAALSHARSLGLLDEKQQEG